MIVRDIGGKARKACPSCRYIHFVEAKVGVGCMLIEDGALLLVKRARDPEKGKWCVPAGFLDYGEDPRETAAREMLEETSLRVRVTELVDVFYSPGGPGASVFILYRAERLGGEPHADDDALEVGFFRPHEIPEIAFESTEAAVRALERGR